MKLVCSQIFVLFIITYFIKTVILWMCLIIKYRAKNINWNLRLIFIMFLGVCIGCSRPCLLRTPRLAESFRGNGTWPLYEPRPLLKCPVHWIQGLQRKSKEEVHQSDIFFDTPDHFNTSNEKISHLFILFTFSYCLRSTWCFEIFVYIFNCVWKIISTYLHFQILVFTLNFC